MTKTELVVIIIFIAWLSAGICYPVFNKQMAKYTNRWDIFRLISAYQLFSWAPRDYQLFYRDKQNDATETGWLEIPLTAGHRWYNLALFPKPTGISNLNWAVDELITFIKVKNLTPAMDTVADRFIYQTILRFVNSFEPDNKATARQFKIEQVGGFTDGQKAQYVYISHFNAA
ncbi:hypothetical protein BH09BAC6_BH09BAC6_10140 [soil metagenome]|jgi:hypothetical protein